MELTIWKKESIEVSINEIITIPFCCNSGNRKVTPQTKHNATLQMLIWRNAIA